MWEDKHMSNLGAIMASEIAETPKVFKAILDNKDAFNSVKNVLVDEKIQSVLILARGTSDNAAHYLKYLIETQIGLPVGLTSPSSVTVYGSELKYSNTLVVAISQSGQSPDLVKFATAARQANAYVIAMTNDDSSPLATVAHNHFSLLAGPELAVAATKSYNAQLLVSYLLVAAWTGKQVNGEQIISEAARLVGTTDLVSKAVAAATRDNEVVILGRGFAYPNAREAALKIQETCKISVQGLSTADYLHGPISALTPETQVFIVAPAHLPTPSITEAVVKIRATNPRIFWIGNGGTPTGDDIVLAGSTCDDEVASTLVDAIVLQRFALEFAVASGYDPAKIFYCAESILLTEYRGRGIYPKFFEAREGHARHLGRFDLCTFCCVQRPVDHPLRPKDYVPLDRIWTKFGYVKNEALTTTYDWKDVDQADETPKPMVFWTKSLVNPS